MASSLNENEAVSNSREPFNYEVKAHYGVIIKSATGWTKEGKLVSWN